MMMVMMTQRFSIAANDAMNVLSLERKAIAAKFGSHKKALFGSFLFTVGGIVF